nr:WG repeat-containing protein [Pseudomonas sp. BIGb0427]
MALKTPAAKVIVAPSIELQPVYHEGMAAVRINNKWGYMDRKAVAHPDPLQAPRAVQRWPGRRLPDVFRVWLHRCRGRTVVPFEYDWVEGFDDAKDGLAVVAKGNLFGMINRKGEQVIPPALQLAAHYREGLCAAERQRQQKAA